MRDTEYTLRWNDHSAVVSPFGASLRRYFVRNGGREWDVIWGYSGGENKKGGQGDVLIPFPGRIKNATYKFENAVHQLARNDKDGPNAIHGFVRSELFKTESLSDQQAIFSFEITSAQYAEKGFPFSLHIEVSYHLNGSGLRTSYKIANTGKTAAPVGIGFHPYFRADKGTLADWSVKIPAKDYVELDHYVPTGRILPVVGSKLDFRKNRLLGGERYNDCLVHLERNSDGFSSITLQAPDSKNRVRLSLDKSFDYVVIYTGDQIPAPDQRQGFAIEPMTCAPDAFNHEGWGTQIINAGAEISGTYTMLAEVNEDV